MVLFLNSEIIEIRIMSYNVYMRNNSYNEIRFMQLFIRYFDILVEQFLYIKLYIGYNSSF